VDDHIPVSNVQLKLTQLKLEWEWDCESAVGGQSILGICLQIRSWWKFVGGPRDWTWLKQLIVLLRTPTKTARSKWMHACGIWSHSTPALGAAAATRLHTHWRLTQATCRDLGWQKRPGFAAARWLLTEVVS